MPDKRLHVAVAAIRDSENHVLLAKRHPDSHQGGLWEFPGGKVEQGETVVQALARELLEELRINVTEARPLIRIPHDYPDRRVLLDVWLVTAYTGKPSSGEGQDIEWVDTAQLKSYPMPVANLPIISALELPDVYLITPDPGRTEIEWQNFLSQLERTVANGIELVQFRAKSLGIAQYAELAKDVLAICHNAACRVVLNVTCQDSRFPDADGMHMSSTILLQQQERMLGNDRLLAASCHNMFELKHANEIGCDFAVLSPVEKTASHPDTAVLGWDEFGKMCEVSRIPVYALGGMTANCLPIARKSGAQGVSGITAFWHA